MSEDLCLGVGHLSILLGAANSVLFLIFHLKYAYIDSYRHFYKEFLNTYALLFNTYALFTTLHPLDFFASVYEIASRHHGQLSHGGKTIIASFEEKNRKA